MVLVMPQVALVALAILVEMKVIIIPITLHQHPRLLLPFIPALMSKAKVQLHQ
jgi:hypothetical protein